MLSIVLLMTALFTLHADVKSTTGTIHFDANDDSTPEMILSGNRLGIGTLTPSANLHVNGNAMITSSLIIGGTTNPSNSNLHIHGTIAHASQSFGAGISNLTSQSLVTVDTSAGDAAIYLPSAVAYPNHQITIKRISNANYLYISAGGNLMDNYSIATFGSGNYTSIDLISDGANWFFLGGVGLESAKEHEYLYWNLNNTSGNTASDQSVWARHGTLSNNHQFTGNSIAG